MTNLEDKMDQQTRDNTLNEYRLRYQQYDNRMLSDIVANLARMPRRYNPIEREAILLTAASRLWAAGGLD